MTMDVSASEVEYLTGTILEKQEVVTFRTLSRELNVHHAHAKKVLYNFYAANKDKLNAKFVVSGKNSKAEYSIQLFDDSILLDLALLEASMSEIHGVHIYCVSSSKIAVSDIQISLEQRNFPMDYAKLEAYFHNGLLRGPKLVVFDESVVSSKSRAAAKPVPTAATLQSRGAEPVLKEEPKKAVSTGLTSGYVSRKAQAAQAAQTGPSSVQKHLSTGLSSNYKSRKQTTPQTSSSTAGSGYQYKSRKAEKAQPKERVVVADSAHDTEEDAEEIKPNKRVKPQEMKNLFEDDNSDFSDDDIEEVKEPIVVESIDTEHKPQSAQKENVDVVEVGSASRGAKSKVGLAHDVVSQIKPKHEEMELEQEEEVEDDVKQPEVESYVDEDGYLVTVNKAASKPKPKKPASPAPSVGSRDSLKRAPPFTSSDSKKKKTGQKQSVLSFFSQND